MLREGLAVVHTAQGLARANVIKAHLESHGIPVALDYESVGPVIGITVDGLGEVRILVPERLAQRARRVLRPRRPPRRWRRRAVRARRPLQGRARGRQARATEARRR
jgi:hypothetical protein